MDGFIKVKPLLCFKEIAQITSNNAAMNKYIQAILILLSIEKNKKPRGYELNILPGFCPSVNTISVRLLSDQTDYLIAEP